MKKLTNYGYELRAKLAGPDRARIEDVSGQSICLEPVWDGPYRMMCGLGAGDVCARHGEHRPHPDDGRPCEMMADGYCSTHGVYAQDAYLLGAGE